MTEDKLTIREAIARTTPYLEQKGCASPRLDAELLLAEILETDRLHLYLDMERPLNAEERNEYREFVRRRAAHEPVAYILGYKEFYGLPFHVSRHTLIPRPETEFVVESAIAYAKEMETPSILDIGTGSGAIAIALARELENARIVATDTSLEALEVARENAAQLGVAPRIEFVHGDLFADLRGPFDLIVSNPPYVPESDREEMQSDVLDYEPQQALFAGVDGLDIIRKLIATTPDYLADHGNFIFEFGFGQSEAIQGLIRSSKNLNLVKVVNDLRGIPRVVVVEKK